MESVWVDFVLTVSSEPLSLFVTQLSVVRGHKPECHVQKLICYLPRWMSQ